MSEKRPIIFSDFDGTFTEKDIGYRIFSFFSDRQNQKLVEDWKKGLISSRDCLLKEAAMLNCSLEEIYAFLDNYKLASGAEDFYKIVTNQEIPFYIVSDGIDIYIDYILNKFGLGEIKQFSNRGTVRNNRMTLEFIYDNYDCHRCGCCKGARIIDHVGNENKNWNVIFIGDGFSDICALPQSDIIFARGDLLNYCRKKDINAIEYEDFFDIIDCLRKLTVFAD
jgi:2-hydroxy-3-keto-5-methylthiopentenyl-1-phosphate phosphatase